MFTSFDMILILEVYIREGYISSWKCFLKLDTHLISSRWTSDMDCVGVSPSPSRLSDRFSGAGKGKQ